MPTEPNYFGMKLGEAISSGAGHISEGLRRRYELQRQNELMAKREQDQKANKDNERTFEMQKMGYDNTPESLAQFISDRKKQREVGGQKTQAEINLLNKRAATVGVKPPTNYRYTEDGNLEAIPGSAAYEKLQEKDIKKEQAAKSYDLKIKNVKDTIDSALEQVGYTTAGLGGKILGGIGMTAPVDLEGALNTIKSNLGFDRLTQMRAESPTGGALGNVSDRELQLLTSTVQSLDQRQSPATLKKNLEIIKGYLDDSTNIIQTSKIPIQVQQRSEIALSPEKAQRLIELRAKAGR